MNSGEGQAHALAVGDMFTYGMSNPELHLRGVENFG